MIELDLKKSGEQPPGNIVYIGDIPKNVEQLTPRRKIFFKMKNERYIKLRGHVEEAELAKPETKDSNFHFCCKARKEEATFGTTNQILSVVRRCPAAVVSKKLSSISKPFSEEGGSRSASLI